MSINQDFNIELMKLLEDGGDDDDDERRGYKRLRGTSST